MIEKIPPRVFLCWRLRMEYSNGDFRMVHRQQYGQIKEEQRIAFNLDEKCKATIHRVYSKNREPIA